MGARWSRRSGSISMMTAASCSRPAPSLSRARRSGATDGSLCVDDQTPPYSYVRVDGTAEVSERPDELFRWATRLARRYMGADGLHRARHGRSNHLLESGRRGAVRLDSRRGVRSGRARAPARDISRAAPDINADPLRTGSG